ncbi:Ger(x)C family spore germination protein [Neobacillus sp. NPDC058068]|uniref:Ger(x)C family spore germination protein n=1 Tax=Neobacillus sp. NPDC058068 TaxID=3346325 RepID=UPI0036DCF298
MKGRQILCFGFCFSLLFISGCWDRKELNDRAIWLATGWDLGENGGVQISGQIVIPSNIQTQGGGGGTMTKGFFNISESGKDFSDALQNLQAKLPREAFFGQRRVVFFGEEFAKRGLKEEMDINNRSPDVSLRTDIFVVKGSTAKDALNLANPLESHPAVAALKDHEQSGGRGDTAYLNFLLAATSAGFRPTIPIIEISQSQERKHSGQQNSTNPPLLKIAGAAVFDENLKMIGRINMEENRHLLWVMGLLKKLTISIPKNEGNASIVLTKIDSKIKPTFSKDKRIRIKVYLTGEGALTESNTGLNVEYSKNLSHLQKSFETYTQKQVQQTVTKVQKEYGLDIFGLGEVIHRKHPRQWKTLKNDWDKKFSEAEIIVKVDLKIKQIGMSGPSLLFKESEIKK